MTKSDRSTWLSRTAALAAVALVWAITSPAQDRTGVVRLQAVPDRPDWTYAPGAPVSFRVFSTRDGQPLALPSVTWKVGPEMRDPVEEKTAPLPAEGAVVRAAGLKQPGFVRLVAKALDVA